MSQMPPPEGSWVPGPLGSWPQPATVQWPPPRPPRRGGALKWVLGAVALLAVIGLTVVVTLAVVGRGGGSSEEAAGGGDSDIASANDTGPVSVITDDPSCDSAMPIMALRAYQQRNGWDRRDPSIPATSWTPEIRAQYDAVADILLKTSDMLATVATLTPHRVMRELYEQTIAYSRAYVDAIPTYVPADNNLVLVAIAAGGAINEICAAISLGSAESRSQLVLETVSAPRYRQKIDVQSPQMFLADGDSVCGEWSQAWSTFQDETAEWRRTNPNIPESEWSSRQRSLNKEVAPIMMRFADQMQAIAAQSSNDIFRDFGNLAAQYRRAYVRALPSYSPTDRHLAATSQRLSGVIEAACRASAR